MRKLIIIILSILLITTFTISVFALDSNNSSSYSNEETSSGSDFLLNSPLFTSPEKDVSYNPEVPDNISEGFTEVIDQNEMTLYIDEYSLAFRLFNKETSYTWASDIINIDNYEINNAQKKYARSSFEYYYRTSEGVVKKRYTTDSKIEKSYEVSGNKVIFNIDDTKSSIKFSYYIELVGSRLTVHLDNSSIIEYGDNLITQISFYQYFGSVYENSVEGYFFIPSGNGGLIRFNEHSAINSTYSESFYGTDFNRVQNSEDENLNLPIYGYTHFPNHNAVLVEVTSGSAFASLNYTPSNVGRNFNMLYTSFSLREAYVLSISGSDSILKIPEERYKSDIELTFDFLSNNDASYVGMANKYKENLISRGQLSKESYDNNVHLDFFGEDTSEGLIFTKTHTMTTTKDIVSISNELEEENINSILYTLRGFNKGGYSELSGSNYKFNSSLGSLSDLKDLDYYMYYNPTESYSSTYSTNSNTLVDVYNTRGVIEIEKNVKYKLISNVAYSVKYTKEALKSNEKIAIDGYGNYLYGDSDNNYTREEAYALLTNSITEKVPMFKPNAYFFTNTSAYLNMPLYHDGLRFITDSVPFLQIVLSGYIPYYSTYLNFSANQKLDVLKCVEYGSFPSYLLTEEESHNLSDTLSSNLYATTYSRLSSDMTKNINYINGALSYVSGSSITGREVLDSGVVKVTYDSGVSIIVNYKESSYNYNGTIINSMDYEVLK